MRRPLGWRERKAPVKDHKTAVTGGPAKLVVDKDMKTTMDAYLEYRRGHGSSEKLLVSHRGTPSSKLPTLVQAFARSYGVDIPTPSLHRKVIGSRAVSLPEEQGMWTYGPKHANTEVVLQGTGGQAADSGGL